MEIYDDKNISALQFTELSDLEKKASSGRLSIEGSWYIMLETAEDILNHAFLRDGASNKVLNSFLGETAERKNRSRSFFKRTLDTEGIISYINKEGTRPFPYDDFMVLIDYCGKQLEAAAERPGNKIEKTTKMQRPEKLKKISSKTVKWIGRQPGRNIREKLASSKGKMPVEKKSRTYNTVENQAAMKLYKTIKKLYCIKKSREAASGYDKGSMDIIDERLKKLSRIVEKSHIYEAKADAVLQPNNILMSDNNYSVIWKAYRNIKNYKADTEQKWNKALMLYVKAVYICICAKMYVNKNIKTIEEKKDFTSDKLNCEFVMEDNDKNTVFIKISLDENCIVISFQTENASASIESGYKENKELPEVKKNSDDTKDYAKSEDKCVKESIIKKEISFFFNAGGKEYLEKRRGYPLNIMKNTGEIFNIKADFKGTKSACGWILKNIEEEVSKEIFTSEIFKNNKYEDKSYAKNEFKEEDFEKILWNKEILNYKENKSSLIKNNINEEDKKVLNSYGLPEGTCVFDILQNGEIFNINGIRIKPFYSQSAVLYRENEEEKIYRHDNKSIYKNSEKIIKISDACSTRKKDERGLNSALKDISSILNFKTDDYFIYTVPDFLDEFSQQKIKENINIYFSRSFPVWRSVAALTEKVYTKTCFKENDTVLSIDIMGNCASAGLLKLSKEKRIDNFLINRYSPLPADEKAAKITEKYIIRKYLEILQKNEQKFQDSLIKNIVSGKEIRLLLKEKDENKVYKVFYCENNSIKFISLKYRKDYYEQCLKEWKNDIKEYFNEVQKHYEKSGKTINYIMISCSILEDYLKEKNDSSIIICSSEDISRGAFRYAERLRKNLPTWKEYMPKLSLEVIFKGNYRNLELINEGIAFDISSKTNIHEVSETLVLPAGKKEYRFPLIKKNLSGGDEKIEAYLKDDSFPLEEDLRARLRVAYKYGFVNSYELTLVPADETYMPFEEIEVEWKDAVYEKKESKAPGFPPETNQMKTRLDINRVMKNLKELNRIFSILYPDSTLPLELNYRIRNPFLKNIYNENENFEKLCRPLEDYEEEDFDMLSKKLMKLNFVIRNIAQHDNNYYYDNYFGYTIENFIDEFYSHPVIKICRKIAGIDEMNPELQNKSAPLKCSAIQLLCSFGGKSPEEIQRFVLDNYKNFKFKYKENILMNLLFLNSENEEIMKLVKKQTLLKGKKGPMVKNLAIVCWFDKNLIFNIGKDKEFLDKIITHIMKHMKDDFGKSRIKRIVFQKSYLKYLEMILAILRLRKDPEFNRLEAGSEEAVKLAGLVRKADARLQELKINLMESQIRLKVKKPAALRNMNDMVFAVDCYLTGNEGTDSITILSME